VKRRSLLIGSLGIAVVAALGVLGAEYATETEIVSGIRRRLPFLKFDTAGLHRFAKDYEGVMLQKRPSWYRWKYHFHNLFNKPPAAQWGISNDKRNRKEHLEDDLATLYLLSSDFFANGADESRVIQYLAYYDPMKPCNNWFARPVIVPNSAAS
jgi:hypothetical protein